MPKRHYQEIFTLLILSVFFLSGSVITHGSAQVPRLEQVAERNVSRSDLQVSPLALERLHNRSATPDNPAVPLLKARKRGQRPTLFMPKLSQAKSSPGGPTAIPLAGHYLQANRAFEKSSLKLLRKTVLLH